MKDEAIIELFWNRTEKAIEESQTKYKRYCTCIAKNILENDQDAEECVNEALNAVWQSIPPQRPSNLKAYFGKITREISISRWRANHAAKRYRDEFSASLEEIEEIAVNDNFDAALETRQISRSVSDFLRTVPEIERNMMIRRYFYGDSIRQICERFGCSEGKVKVQLHRTRKKLREHLKKEGWIS